MMKEKTKSWMEIAENDMAFAEEVVANGKRPQYAVHFCHQAIEKVLKACVQEKTTEDPRRTHNFKLLCQQGKFILPPHIEDFLARLSPHYLSSKYPEDMKQYYKDYTLEVAKEWVLKTREVFTWFKQLMTSKN